MEKKNKKVLIVDDSSTMRRIIKNTLQRIGFINIFEAEDGIDASNKCNEIDFDIIFTDWNMPNMNGLEFVNFIRKQPKYDLVPIIMITTEGGKVEVITALKAGVNNYIVKPFTPQVLKDKLDVVLK